jgi:hypothetical protein
MIDLPNEMEQGKETGSSGICGVIFIEECES